MNIKSKSVITWTAVFLIVLGTIALLSRVPKYIQKATVNVLQERLGRKVTFEDVKFNYLTSTVHLNGLKIMEKDENEVFVAFESLDVNVDPIKFISRTLYIKEISLVKPSIRLDFSDDKRNFDDIIERIKSKSSEKPVDDQQQKFLKKVKIRDIKIDQFVVYQRDEVIKSENSFTFKAPEIVYEDNVLKFLSQLELENIGSTKLEFLLDNSTGDLNGSLNIDEASLSKIDYTKKWLPKLGESSGTLSGIISFSGNTKDKKYILSGNFNIDGLIVKDDSGNAIISSKSLNMDSVSFSYPDMNIKFGNVAAETLSIAGDYLKKVLSEKNISTSEKKVEKKESRLDISVKEFSLKDSSVSYKDYNLKNITLISKNLSNNKGTSFPLSLSFDLNDNIVFSSDSQADLLNNIEKGVDFKSLLSMNGSFSMDIKNLGILNILKNDLPYKLNSDNLHSNGSYSFKFPNINLSLNAKLASLTMSGQNKMLNDITVGNAVLSNQVSLNLKDKLYSVSGPASFEKFLLYNKDGKQMITGKLSLQAENISKDKFLIQNFSADNMIIDLSKKLQLSKKTDKKGVLPLVKISQLDLKGKKIVFKDMFLEDLSVTAKNFSSNGGSSSINGNTKINGNIPVKGNGVLNIETKIVDMDSLSNFSFEGNVVSQNLNLKYLESFLKNKTYNLNGLANLKSKVAYSKESLSTSNEMLLKQVRVSNDNSSNELYFKDGNADFKLDIKKKTPELYSGNFLIDSFKFKSSDKFNAEGDSLDLNIDRASKSKISINTLNAVNPYMLISQKDDKKSAEKKERPEINIKKSSIKNGQLDIYGKRKYDIKNLNADITNFSTSKNNKFNATFKGLLLGSGNFTGNAVCFFSNDWDFSTKTMGINGKVSIQNLDMLNFDDIISANFPSKLNSGRLFYDGTYDLDTGIFSGKNSILIKEISFGQSTGNFLSVPLDRAINKLKDKNGNISLNIPVSGDFNDPNFSFSKSLSQGIRNILIKAAASSSIEVITKNIFGSEKKEEQKTETESLYFQFLSDEFSQTELKKLDAIAEKLNSETNLRADFVLFTDSKKEKELLRIRSIGLAIFKGNINEIVNSDFQDLINSRGETIRSFFRDKGIENRITIKASDEARSLPQATVNFTTIE